MSDDYFPSWWSTKVWAWMSWNKLWWTWTVLKQWGSQHVTSWGWDSWIQSDCGGCSDLTLCYSSMDIVGICVCICIEIVEHCDSLVRRLDSSLRFLSTIVPQGCDLASSKGYLTKVGEKRGQLCNVATEKDEWTLHKLPYILLDLNENFSYISPLHSDLVSLI